MIILLFFKNIRDKQNKLGLFVLSFIEYHILNRINQESNINAID